MTFEEVDAFVRYELDIVEREIRASKPRINTVNAMKQQLGGGGAAPASQDSPKPMTPAGYVGIAGMRK